MALCLDCGLFYLVDRFSADGYSEFYAGGAYRTVSSQFNGVTHAIDEVQANQVGYARNLVRALAGFCRSAPRRQTARRGRQRRNHSSGARQRIWSTRHGARPRNRGEVAAARAAGLDAIEGSLEDWNTTDRFDLILLCRSIEHLFDLRQSLSRIRSLLTPDGLFYCDIADFMEMCRSMGPPETFTKVDHCYWLTQSTALQIFRSLGFELVSMNIVSGVAQVGFLLRACEPSPEPLMSQSRTLAQVEEIQLIEREWRAFGATSLGPKDWLRRKAYRIKRKIIRLFGSRESVTAAKPVPVAGVQNLPKTT